YGAGGIKMAACDGASFDSNIAFCNKGIGLWADILCKRGSFRNNIVWDNWGEAAYGGGAGISYEVSSFGVIRDNVAFRTPNIPGGLANNDIGIFVSNSRWVDVYANLVMHLPRCIKYQWTPGRTDDPPSGSQDNTHMGGVTIHGNRIIGRYHAADHAGNSDYAIVWGDDGTGTYSAKVASNSGGITAGANSVADGDIYGYPALLDNGANFLEVQQEPDIRWAYDAGPQVFVNTLASWRTAQATGGSVLGANARYMTDADRAGHLERWGLIP
ncbi:MAG: hypothetical protein J2P17_21485, partial [Mycobacterium sp.]|nr:hypothetical protein [Mycobacterium sp.]